MRRHHHRLLTAAALVLLAGCQATKADPPLVRTEVVTLPQAKFVGLTPELEELTEPCPIAEGTLAQVVEVARLRKEALEGCANADKAAIRELLRKAGEQSGGD